MRKCLKTYNIIRNPKIALFELCVLNDPPPFYMYSAAFSHTKTLEPQPYGLSRVYRFYFQEPKGLPDVLICFNFIFTASGRPVICKYKSLFLIIMT